MAQSIRDAGPNHPPEAEQVAAYVASLARELKAMADSQRLSALGYLLDLVRIEAEERAGPESKPEANGPHRRFG
jgi:hypothetical protein